MPRTNRPRSYSTAHVAQRLGISVPTVQRWVDAGQLQAWKTPGGHRRIDAESVERLYQARLQELPSATPLVPATLSVMVVEDDDADRELLAALVGTALPDARVSLFESAIQALVAIGQTPPDIVITDIVMPHMNGVEMLRQLASQCVVRPRLIMAVSSLTRRQLARLGELPAEVRYIAKPIAPQPFIEALQAVV